MGTSPWPSTIKHPMAVYPTADYPKFFPIIFAAAKKQRTNQLQIAAKFGGSSAIFDGIPEKNLYSSEIVNIGG